jgi:Mrp family chromosome partitioning ATPase
LKSSVAASKGSAARSAQLAVGRSSSVRPAPGKERGIVAYRRGETILEHFRRIYLSMQPLDTQDLISAIGVTSASEGEGRTTVAVGIAAAMAADLDAPVVLVEADLSHPGVHRVLGIAPEPGICEYLRNECELATALRQVSDHLFVLPAGNARGQASRLIRQLTAGDLRQRLDASGALLVFDLPPILTSSYGVLATTIADSITFVVRAGQTRDYQMKEALTRMDDNTVRSVVLNATDSQLPRWLRGRV